MESAKRGFVRRNAVISLCGTSKTSLYRYINAGIFTRPVKIANQRAAGWPVSEIEALNAARIAGKSDDEIRELVASLHAARLSSQEELAGQA